MSLVKRKKILEKADNVVGYFGILLMISLFCLIFLYPEFFSREFWLEILILFIAGIHFQVSMLNILQVLGLVLLTMN